MKGRGRHLTPSTKGVEGGDGNIIIKPKRGLGKQQNTVVRVQSATPGTREAQINQYTNLYTASEDQTKLPSGYHS